MAVQRDDILQLTRSANTLIRLITAADPKERAIASEWSYFQHSVSYGPSNVRLDHDGWNWTVNDWSVATNSGLDGIEIGWHDPDLLAVLRRLAKLSPYIWGAWAKGEGIADAVMLLERFLAAAGEISPPVAVGGHQRKGSAKVESKQRNRKPTRGKSIEEVDATMQTAISEDTDEAIERLTWTLREWAGHCECSPETVRKTATWTQLDESKKQTRLQGRLKARAANDNRNLDHRVKKSPVHPNDVDS
jgi:hypothetical protein